MVNLQAMPEPVESSHRRWLRCCMERECLRKSTCWTSLAFNCGHSLHADFDVVQLDGEISKNIATQPPPGKEEIIVAYISRFL